MGAPFSQSAHQGPYSRIVKSIVPAQHQQQHQLSWSGTRYDGQMAPTLRRKNLACFYCNKQSGIKYDRSIQQWECGNCESMNFLDENGDITDPPVATYDAAPVSRSFAIPRPESPIASQESDNSLFCSTCLKNQHLYTASLAQYDVDLDPSSPHYKENERNYYRYRNGLEKRYPQVCEDCEPKVLEQMRQAGKTAKTDYLRRLMEKSKAKRSSGRGRHWLSMESAGKLLWYLGLFCQLLWHIIALVDAAQHLHPSVMESVTRVTESLTFFFPVYMVTLPTYSLARSSLICSAASVWWNPKFKQMKDGFMNHIQGFGDWYKYQGLLLAIRGLTYFLVGTGVLANPYASSTISAHTVIFVFVTYLAIAAHYSLKVDMTPLWTTPEKLKHVGPRTSPTHAVNPMAEALNELSSSPSRRPNQLSKPFASSSNNYQPASRRNQENSRPAIRDYFETTKPNIALKPRDRSPPSNPSNDIRPIEEMDWSPSQSTQSQHRAFAPIVNNANSNTKLFSQTPVEPQNSPFWYKVPPAPISLAHQLRNPPNQPRLRVSSQEVKENFFRNVARKSGPEDSVQPDGSQQDFAFAQQKFFPPPPPSEGGNSLADLMTSFSLSSVGDEVTAVLKHKTSRTSRKRHVYQCVVLLLALIFWNQALYHPFEQTIYVLLAAMFACASIGIRTMIDSGIFSKHEKHNITAQFLGVILGAAETIAPIYGIALILVREADCVDCSSVGTILIGGMMVHQMWLASFG